MEATGTSVCLVMKTVALTARCGRAESSEVTPGSGPDVVRRYLSASRSGCRGRVRYY